MTQAHKAAAERASIASGWTPERLEQLKTLWADGASGSAIARIMGGLSRAAVIGKVHRLGLQKRSQAVKDANQKQATPRGRAVRGMMQKAPKPRPLPALVPTRTWAPAEPIVERLESPGLCTIVTVGRHQCRWPIGDPQDASFTLCGKRTERTYCEGHAARAYDAPRTMAKRHAAAAARSLRRYAAA